MINPQNLADTMQEKWLHYESSNHDRHFKFRNCYACSSRYSHQFIADAQAGYSFDDRSHIFFSFARSDLVKDWEGNDHAGLHPGIGLPPLLCEGENRLRD